MKGKFGGAAKTAQIPILKKRKRKDHAFRRQFNEKPSIIPILKTEKLLFVVHRQRKADKSWIRLTRLR